MAETIVQAAEKTAADVLIDELDDDVRTMLEDSGVQLEGVCRLLERRISRDEQYLSLPVFRC